NDNWPATFTYAVTVTIMNATQRNLICSRSATDWLEKLVSSSVNRTSTEKWNHLFRSAGSGSETRPSLNARYWILTSSEMRSRNTSGAKVSACSRHAEG